MTDPSLNERLAEEETITLNARVLREVLGYGLLTGRAVPKKYRHLNASLEEQQVWWKSEKDHYCVLCGEVPDLLTYPGMGVVLEAMRERPVSTRREFARLLSVAAITRTPRDGGGPLWILEIFDPELVAEAAVEALEGEADGRTS